MGKRNSNSQGFALVLLIAGFITYILADSGLLFSLSEHGPSGFAPKRDAVKSVDGMLSYSRQLGNELDKIDSQVRQEKSKLHTLQKEVAQYESRLKARQKDLKEIEREIEGLKNLRESVALAQRTVGKDVRRPGSTEAESRPSEFKVAPRTENDLIEYLEEATSRAANLQSTNYIGRDFTRVKTELKFGSESQIYLTPTGMRQIRIIAEGALALGYHKLALAYAKGDEIGRERALVVQRFVREVFNHEVETIGVPAELAQDLTNGFEVWMGKDGKS
ncbi:MAG: hypothetical protein HC902_05045 [Calothrix sp. SM1_5_4]|nr:hypothetical protein [Calothrix sp. SM1_5_4]